MPLKGFKILIITLAVLGALLCAAILLLVSAPPESVKDRLKEQIVSPFGEDAQLISEVDLRLFPPGVALTDLSIKKQGREIVSVSRVRADIALLPLFRGAFQLSRLSLQKPNLLLPLKLPAQTPPQEGKAATIEIGTLIISDATVRVRNKNETVKPVLSGLNIKISNFNRLPTEAMQFSGDVQARELNIGRVTLTNLSGTLVAKERRYQINNLSSDLYGGQAQGEFSVDHMNEDAAWKGKLEASSVALDVLTKALSGHKIFSGDIHLKTDLSGRFGKEFFDHLNGSLELSGADITQYGFDLDRFIKRVEASRNINLLDIGLYTFAGPIGALASKGVDFARLAWAANNSDQQQIEKFMFNWSLEDGIARASDVALRTKENRLAFSGTVNLAQRRYEGLTLGLLNAQGCAELTEKISGPLHNPVIEKTGILGTFAESLFGILKQGWNIIDLSECEPFYKGSVEHPD